MWDHLYLGKVSFISNYGVTTFKISNTKDIEQKMRAILWGNPETQPTIIN